MNHFTQQLPVLIGVVIGALASYLTTSATERARWRRQHATRWDDKRAEVYSDYGNAVKNAYIASMRIASNSNRTTAKEVSDYQQALGALEQATLERTAKWESVLLLGNPDTVAAARAWHRSVWKLQDIAHGAPISSSEKQSLISEFEVTRLRFYEAARNDLGITSGQLPRGEIWEWDRSDPTLNAGPGAGEQEPLKP